MAIIKVIVNLLREYLIAGVMIEVTCIIQMTTTARVEWAITGNTILTTKGGLMRERVSRSIVYRGHGRKEEKHHSSVVADVKKCL